MLIQTQKKIERAVKDENVEFSERIGSMRLHEKGDHRQSNILFICTKEGVYDAPDTLGKMQFTLHENVHLQDVYVRANELGQRIEGTMSQLLHVDIVVIFSRYRGFGLSEKLLNQFFDIVDERYPNVPMSLEFINPVAEYVMRKVLKHRKMEHLLDEKLVRRYYDEEDATVLHALQKKEPSFFPASSTKVNQTMI